MTSTPCAACKFLRRKCTQECVFAPYFSPTEPQKFEFVHRVFGASNVAKILNELPNHQREDAVNSLFYEAEARLRDPVYGCVGLISILQQRLKKIQQDLIAAKQELATYVGTDAVGPYLPPPGLPPAHFMAMPPSSSQNPLMPLMGIQQGGQQNANRTLIIREPNQQAPQQQPMFMAEPARFGGGFEQAAAAVTVTGFNNLDVNAGGAPPALALGSFGDTYQIPPDQNQQQQLQTQLMLQPPLQEEHGEGQFLVQPLMQEQLEPEHEQQQIQEEQGRPGSEEASN